MNKEEESFARALDLGEQHLRQYAEKAKRLGEKVLSDEDVRHLYDTYGIFADLTRLMAQEYDLGVNEQEFENAQASKFRESYRMFVVYTVHYLIWNSLRLVGRL